MKTKTCFKCGIEKPLDDFYKHSGMADGHLNKCKDCAKIDANKNRGQNIEYYQEYDRQRGGLPHRVEARRIYQEENPEIMRNNRKLYEERHPDRLEKSRQDWVKNNPEKRQAQITFGNAIRSGKVIKGTECEVCGSKENLEGHHEDYSKPLEVVWLCKKHHREADKIRRMMEFATAAILE